MLGKLAFVSWLVFAVVAVVVFDRAGAPAQTVGAQAIYIPPAGTVTAGVTVPGHGAVEIPPDRARFVVHLFALQRPGAAPAAQGTIEDAGNAIAAAMRKAGVADAHFELPLEGNVGAGSQPVIVGTVTKPTRESVERMVRDTIKALPDSFPAASVSYQVQSVFVVDDCAPAEARAQKLALADARARAERAAAAAGVRIGAVVAINESGNYPSLACRNEGQYGAATNNPQGTEFGPLVVSIGVSANVTYALVR